MSTCPICDGAHHRLDCTRCPDCLHARHDGPCQTPSEHGCGCTHTTERTTS